MKKLARTGPKTNIQVVGVGALYVICVLVLGATSDAAQHSTDPEPVVILTGEQEEYPLGMHLDILEDPDKQWTIEDITSPEISQLFLPSQDESPNFGFTDSAIWVRFRMQDAAAEPTRWLLAVTNNLFFIDLYRVNSDQSGYEALKTGAARSFDSREIAHPDFVFDLSHHGVEEQIVYLRFEGESSMSLPMTIWSAEALAQKDLLQQTLNGFVYGILFIMFGYNLILFASLRDKSYLYYALFLFSMMISFMWTDNFAHQYLWPNLGGFNAIIGQLSGTLVFMFAVLFSRSFLLTREYAPRIDKVFVILISIYVVFIPVQFISIGVTARPLALMVAITFGTIVTASFLVFRRGYRPARYFLLAWLLLLASISLFVLSIFAFTPFQAFSVLGTQIGVVVLTLTLSLALAERIRTFREEKEAAQLEVMHQQQETIRLKDELARSLQDMNIALEANIENRTRELSFALAQLNILFETSPLGIGLADIDGQVLSANPALASILGYTVAEYIQMSVVDFFPSPEHRQEMMHRLETEQTIHATPIQLRHKDGSLVYATLTESKLSVGDQDVLLTVVNDITDRIEAEEVQKAASERAAVAEERNRIARELHDSVTQALYTTSLIAEALPDVWQTHPDEALKSLEELRHLTQGSLAEMRTLLLELRPGELIDRELSELLRQLADAMSARTDLPITTTIIGSCELPTDVQIAFYRIAQESLNNVVKHARATIAHVSLICYPGSVILRIRDDGRGFMVKNGQPQQLGLHIMRERAEKIGARLSINSQPQQGTEVLAEWQDLSEDE